MNRALALLLLAACGARTQLGVTHDAGVIDGACHDEVIAEENKGAGGLVVDGDTVAWGTPDGFVRLRNAAGTTTTLVHEDDAIGSLEIDATSVYYAVTGAIRRVPRVGGAATTIASNVGSPVALVLRGDLYFVDYGGGIAAGSVNRIDNAGNVTKLVVGIDTPSGFAVDDDNVYVAAELVLSNPSPIEAPLFSAPKNTGDPLTTLRQSLFQPAGLTLDESNVYFIEQVDSHYEEHGGVRAMAKTGGVIKNVVTTNGVLPWDVAVDAKDAYVTTTADPPRGALVRAPLDGSGGSEIASTDGVLYAAVRTNASAVFWTIGWVDTPPDHASVRKKCK